jgi:hypothetical protein
LQRMPSSNGLASGPIDRTGTFRERQGRVEATPARPRKTMKRGRDTPAAIPPYVAPPHRGSASAVLDVMAVLVMLVTAIYAVRGPAEQVRG